MNGVYLIFDYFKEAFNLNKSNKSLYKPQIILIVVRTLMMSITALCLSLVIYALSARFSFLRYFHSGLRFLPYIGLGFGIVLIYLIFNQIIEAGLYNMYKSCVLFRSVKKGDFWEGVRKYFFKFLFGDIFIVIAWIVCAVPYLLFGVATFSIGFTIVPLVVSIFLTMWKVSLAMNDSGIFDAIKDSFDFAKNNFFPLTILQIINWSFTRTLAQTNGFGRVTDILNSRNNVNPSGALKNEFRSFMLDYFNNINNLMIIIIPIAIIVVIIAGLIKMVFDVYFSIVLFVTYKNKFEEIIPVKEEVLS